MGCATKIQSVAWPVVLIGAWAGSGCTEEVPGREAVVVDALVTADLPLIRARPQLTEGKYRRMASSLYAFYRGSFFLYLRDAADTRTGLSVTSFDVPGALPLTMGDAHPENYGTLLASDGTFAVEPNDFDGADRYPYLWEVRRLCIGMVLGARLSNEDDDEARAAAVASEREVAAQGALGYAQTMVALADGAPPERYADDRGSAVLANLFRRSERDLEDREELEELTDLTAEGQRRLKRGQVDPDDPENIYLDVPEVVREALPTTLERYRQTLIAPPPAEQFALLDAARELASGIASWPRVRIILLVRGPSDDPTDDVVLELKELIDSGAPGWIEPGVSFNSVQDRVLGSARRLWARPDAEPLWGVGEMLGFPVQIKSESEALKTIRVDRFEGALGDPEELARLSNLLGRLMARMHASNGAALRDAIADRLRGNEEAFAAEQSSVAVSYATQVAEDQVHLRNALRYLGPNLGVPLRPEDAPSPDLQSIYGTPPLAAPAGSGSSQP